MFEVAQTPAAPSPVVASVAGHDRGEPGRTVRDVAASLALIRENVAIQRRVVRAGDVIYRIGEAFDRLFILNTGCCKLVNLSYDGREQLVSFKFRGDWMGFDGIAHGTYGCDAVAMDTGEVWIIRYDKLIAACVQKPALLSAMHSAMSRAIVGDRDSLVSVCTLPADARVAEFLRYWVVSLAACGMRSDQITLHMTRAEIGNFLGLTLETVSRALSKLARAEIITFHEGGRREIKVPDVDALATFVQRCLNPAAAADTVH